jgi:hypothetical protein
MAFDQLREGLTVAALSGLNECFVFHGVGRDGDTGGDRKAGN